MLAMTGLFVTGVRFLRDRFNRRRLYEAALATGVNAAVIGAVNPQSWPFLSGFDVGIGTVLTIGSLALLIRSSRTVTR